MWKLECTVTHVAVSAFQWVVTKCLVTVNIVLLHFIFQWILQEHYNQTYIENTPSLAALSIDGKRYIRRPLNTSTLSAVPFNRITFLPGGHKRKQTVYRIFPSFIFIYIFFSGAHCAGGGIERRRGLQYR